MCHVIAWIIVFAVVVKGIQSTGKGKERGWRKEGEVRRGGEERGWRRGGDVRRAELILIVLP